MMVDTYNLEGHLDSLAASPIARELLEHRGAALRVDSHHVAYAGTLLVQILVAAKRQWQEDCHDFSVAPVSPILATALAELGVDPAAIGAAPEDILTTEAIE
ncbi:STAS domain-containing protein [Gymnodinialimonas sp. 57CJ19]|uniref:STAS domain-containing protein n=1 Tax=Gymnodinialimonas sp. 57CJ19 TaxID=3138498 RepID=UPI003134417F